MSAKTVRDMGARSRFVRADVVHWGNRVDTEDGSRVYFLCERVRLVSALYGGPGHDRLLLYGGPGHDRLLLYEPGVEAFHALDDVDCMTCLVAEARIKNGASP